jgi:hypothetical protein
MKDYPNIMNFKPENVTMPSTSAESFNIRNTYQLLQTSHLVNLIFGTKSPATNSLE